jgi:hypothetical protein
MDGPLGYYRDCGRQVGLLQDEVIARDHNHIKSSARSRLPPGGMLS